MKLNNWEHCSPLYLCDNFEDDFDDIIDHLSSAKVVVELGFGTNVLLPRILKLNVTYYGYEKTAVFVKWAREKFTTNNVHFEVIGMDDLVGISNAITKVNPDTLIIRNSLEYLPNWSEVLDNINNLKVPKILIATFSTPVEVSRSTVLTANKGKNTYTMNFFSTTDICNHLSFYIMTEMKRYKERNVLRIFNLR